eukprot:TRINITY_DN91024_c0_g1_i1.p1 TRINITY_DN91024_c0_g1~~TRINITY_DN91024_c0_g1_i1.p1  ORF type:complete len:243 (-),score=35.81 TRINITY_DN91024_c0_g1_i1:143-871(-)
MSWIACVLAASTLSLHGGAVRPAAEVEEPMKPLNELMVTGKNGDELECAALSKYDGDYYCVGQSTSLKAPKVVGKSQTYHTFLTMKWDWLKRKEGKLQAPIHVSARECEHMTVTLMNPRPPQRTFRIRPKAGNDHRNLQEFQGSGNIFSEGGEWMRGGLEVAQGDQNDNTIFKYHDGAEEGGPITDTARAPKCWDRVEGIGNAVLSLDSLNKIKMYQCMEVERQRFVILCEPPPSQATPAGP